MDAVSNSTICPVCGYDLGFVHWSSLEICPSCGIQFGYDDATPGGPDDQRRIYAEWQEKWIKEGMIWDQGNSTPPSGWNPAEQLKKIK